jgi:sigma-B regulation protein RsbU (phosphoserine phosphatase)
MIDPKTYYRELDSMLARIGEVKSDKNFFISIMKELEQKFGRTFNIRNSHIYEKRGDEFVLISPSVNKKIAGIPKTINNDSEVIRKVLKHGSFIFDDPKLVQSFQVKKALGAVPAAISINSPEGQWMFVFELKRGWIREEVNLFLNAIRTALNYRLFSEKMWTEMDRAVQIQKSLLPKKAPRVQNYQIFGCSQAAEFVGGDFYEYFQFDEDYFGAAIGDASGHGLPAALLVRDVVIGLRMGLTKEMRTVHTLKKLNQVIQRSTYSTNFVSLFIGEIESGGNLFYINAGHPPPFLVKGNHIIDLEATGITLGFMPEITLQRSFVRLEKDSVLIMYTDGIVERENENGEQFGIKRFKELVIKNQKRKAKEIIEIVFETVYDFGNRVSWEDDATMVVIKKLDED